MFIGSGTAEKGTFMDNVDGLAALKSVNLDADYAAVTLALNGKFDARIKELKTAKAELEKTEGIVSTLDDAKRLKAKAAADVEAIDARKAALAEKESALILRENAADGKAADIVSRENALGNAQAELDKQAKSDRDAAERANNALAAREVAVVDARAVVQRDRDVLDAERAAFNSKLESLRA